MSRKCFALLIVCVVALATGCELVRQYDLNSAVPPVCEVGSASGTLVDVNGDYGLIFTAYHVVDGRTDVYPVKFENGEEHRGRRQLYDSSNDLAALIIYRPTIAPAQLGAFYDRQGEILVAGGYGPNNKLTMIRGPIKDWMKPSRAGNRPVYPSAIIDGQALGGDSGGGVFNSDGDYIGVLWGSDKFRNRGDCMVTLGRPVYEFAQMLVDQGLWIPSPNFNPGRYVQANTSTEYALCGREADTGTVACLGKLRERMGGRGGGGGGGGGGECPPGGCLNRSEVAPGTNPFTPEETAVELPALGLILLFGVVFVGVAGYTWMGDFQDGVRRAM